MISSRPNPALIPHANRRILSELLGTRVFTSCIFAAFLGSVLLLQMREHLSFKLYKTQKTFTFKSDPYSGKVNCTYRVVPYKMYGF
jgi:hypothetical protein